MLLGGLHELITYLTFTSDRGHQNINFCSIVQNMGGVDHYFVLLQTDEDLAKFTQPKNSTTI